MVQVQNVDRTRTLYTDLRDERFQTYALKNSEYLIVFSSFWILISPKDYRPNQGDFLRSQKISLITEFQQWPQWKMACQIGGKLANLALAYQKNLSLRAFLPTLNTWYGAS